MTPNSVGTGDFSFKYTTARCLWIATIIPADITNILVTNHASDQPMTILPWVNANQSQHYKVTLMSKTWPYHCQSMLLLPVDLQWSGYGRACSWGTISPWLMGSPIRRSPYCILEVKVSSLGGRSMSPKFLRKLKVNVILLPQYSSQFRIHHKGRQELIQAHRGNPWAFLYWIQECAWSVY